MTFQHRKTATLAAAALLALLAAGCSKPDPDAALRAGFDTGLRSFLAAGHDEVCLGMYDWPIDLTEAEAGQHARHAVQFPVFERLGLVTSTIVPVPKSDTNPDGAVKRYVLTDAGRKFYVPHAFTERNGLTHDHDFCVARVSVAHVDGWQIDAHDAQHPTATVSYSYRIDPAPWMKDAEAQRVLPMIAKVIKGVDGGLQLHQGFVQGPTGWVAVPGAV
jgi:hypothetical protein